MSLLEVKDLDARHGLLQAVRGVSLTIEEGEIFALVGANGAGKDDIATHNRGRSYTYRRSVYG